MDYYGSNDEADPLVKSASKVIAAIIVFIIFFTWEFGLNPSNNHSVEMRNDQVAIVQGVTCKGEPVKWRIQIAETWYGRKGRNYARLNFWVESNGERTRQQQVQIRMRETLWLEGCPGGEKRDIAYIWDISSFSKFVHFRIRPDFELSIINNETSLSNRILGVAIMAGMNTLLSFLLAFTVYGFPIFLLTEEVYDRIRKWVNKKAVNNDKPFMAYHLLIGASLGILIIPAWMFISHALVTQFPVIHEALLYFGQLRDLPPILGLPYYTFEYGLWAGFLGFLGYVIEPVWVYTLKPALRLR